MLRLWHWPTTPWIPSPPLGCFSSCEVGKTNLRFQVGCGMSSSRFRGETKAYWLEAEYVEANTFKPKEIELQFRHCLSMDFGVLSHFFHLASAGSFSMRLERMLTKTHRTPISERCCNGDKAGLNVRLHPTWHPRLTISNSDHQPHPTDPT